MLRRAAEISLAEPDLPQEVVYQGNGQHVLGTLVCSEPAVIRLVQQSLTLIQLLDGLSLLALQCRDTAENAEDGRGQDDTQAFPRLPVQRQAPLEEKPGPRLVLVGQEHKAGSGQRQGMLVGRQALAAGREFLLEAGQLSRVAMEPPESPRHPEQPHRRLDVAVREPGHCGPQIVVLSLQPVEPAELPSALHLGGGRSARATK